MPCVRVHNDFIAIFSHAYLGRSGTYSVLEVFHPRKYFSHYAYVFTTCGLVLLMEEAKTPWSKLFTALLISFCALIIVVLVLYPLFYFGS